MEYSQHAKVGVFRASFGKSSPAYLTIFIVSNIETMLVRKTHPTRTSNKTQERKSKSV